MRYARWIDHFPPWIAFGSVLSTGLFTPRELLMMALPLLGGFLVELLRYDLDRWRRLLEFTALGFFIILVLARTELLPAVTLTIFMLCGIRLALPREVQHRRQLLLMGFLLFLTTGISNQDPSFLFWVIVWTALASGILLELSWQRSALLRRGPIAPPPLRKVLPWTLAAALISVPFFLLLPRLALGIRPFVGIGGFGGARAGFSRILDLGAGKGPIAGNADVVLRIKPLGDPDPRALAKIQRNLALLRGVALESVHGSKWEAVAGDPGWGLDKPYDLPGARESEILLSPDPTGLLLRPYTRFAIQDPVPMSLRSLPGGQIAWSLPLRRSLTIRALHGELGPAGRIYPGLVQRLHGSRLAALLQTDPSHAAARRWSLREAPGETAPRALAEKLTQALLGFGYTLDNPSGRAQNPLQDFLENTRAGHCQYFASALALALRSRDVPARVVNGYRLGPWNDAGGYFVVTQNEAHSWVEYWDPDLQAWRVADPTPPAPPSALEQSTLIGAARRWADALQYHWDRHVVRFSDEDQVEGSAWIQGRFERVKAGTAAFGAARSAWIAVALLLPLLLWRLRARLPGRNPAKAQRPPGIKALKPLVKRAAKVLPPTPGETLRAWMARLARQRPERAGAILRLLGAVEVVAYGNQPDPGLKKMAAEEARNWG